MLLLFQGEPGPAGPPGADGRPGPAVRITFQLLTCDVKGKKTI